MTDQTTTTAPDRSDDRSVAPTDQIGNEPRAGWGAAPTPTAISDSPAPTTAWYQPGPSGATPWYGSTAPTKRTRGPKPPWFWPVIAAAVGLAALLAGGGIGFAVGHAIGGSSQSTTQVPGTGGGTDQLPGGGTGQFPGSGSQGGTDSGSTGTGSGGSGSTGSGSTGTGTSGSTSNS